MTGEEQFRRVMAHFATGVTVVASRGETGNPAGLTVNAFCSVSLDPPLVLICLHKDAHAHDTLLAAGHFGVSVLTTRMEEVAVRFSRGDPEQRFKGLEVVDGALGSPLIGGALAWLECRITEVLPGGDHSIVLGEVVDCGVGEGEPLLFFRGTLMGGAS